MTNRSAPLGPVIPVIGYPDVEAAAPWLCTAFGFNLRLRIPGHRMQLHAFGGNVILAEKEGPCSGFSIMIRVPDVDAHWARAKEHGAVRLSEPTDFPYGERQYTAADPWGRTWTFTQTIADIDPASWGGLLVQEEDPAR